MQLQAQSCYIQINLKKNFLLNEMIMQQAQFKRKIDSLERDIVGF